MNLKEVMNADIDDVFFDPDEFAEIHDVNGKNMLCIIDDFVSKTRTSRQSDDYDGLYLHQIILFVKKSDLGYRPDYLQRMTIDGRWYIVTECADNNGILEITLGANEA